MTEIYLHIVARMADYMAPCSSSVSSGAHMGQQHIMSGLRCCRPAPPPRISHSADCAACRELLSLVIDTPVSEAETTRIMENLELPERVGLKWLTKIHTPLTR